MIVIYIDETLICLEPDLCANAALFGDILFYRACGTRPLESAVDEFEAAP
jgi:hypothetical protein